MEDQKVQYVSGYVRYKKEKSETQDNTLIAAVMAVCILVVLAVVFWQVTLTLAGTGALTYKLHKIHAHREYMKQNGLPVNYLNGKRVYL